MVIPVNIHPEYLRIYVILFLLLVYTNLNISIALIIILHWISLSRKGRAMTILQHTTQLAELAAGERASIIHLGYGTGIASRLSSLGFTPGVEIMMTQNYGRGPLVVTIRGTRVALGRQEARAIQVQRNQG
jgi:ferrous iron transport protein A